MSHVLIRDVQVADHAEWVVLYAGYREFYRMAPDPVVVETTWTWVVTGQHAMRGLVAVGENGELLALANLREFARPSVARMGLYLDDLFTAPAARGRGAGAALLARAAEFAAEQGAVVVRWITASDNLTARRLYDQHATLTPFVTYDIPVGAPTRDDEARTR
jgi:GNAT superfamily N-acetyltransferase